jgi:hypothetical protein
MIKLVMIVFVCILPLLGCKTTGNMSVNANLPIYYNTKEGIGESPSVNISYNVNFAG